MEINRKGGTTLLARQSTFIITSRILDGILAYVALFFITKYMDPATYGTVMFAMGFVALFAVFNKLGLHQAHIKCIHEERDNSKLNEIQ